jgi:hypothetical protein
MQKMILIIATLFLITSASIDAHAQNTEKKEPEKITAVDAWRQALPESEQTSNTPVVVMDESTNRVEVRETPEQVEERILALEQKLMEALKGRDSVALKYLLADDFIPAGVNITAAQPDKARFIEWSLKNLEIKSYTVEKTTVRVYQSTAVVTVQYKRQAAVAGVPSDGNFIATDVWVRRGKQWQAVSHHVSPLPKP